MSQRSTQSTAESDREYNELKEAQERLEQARHDYECGFIGREEYIQITEQCIKTIHACSRPYSKNR